MIEDKNYATNSFLIYRHIVDHRYTFKKGVYPMFYEPLGPYYMVSEYKDIQKAIEDYIKPLFLNNGDTALMLSGGIDSAILARFVPKGTKAFTFRSAEKGSQNEVDEAAIIANQNGLDHEIIDVSWLDYEELMDELMVNKGQPIHSIEVQIYKAALAARGKGFKNLLFGENADAIFGGQSDLYSRSYTLDEFWNRYSFINPFDVLKEPLRIDHPYRYALKKDGEIDIYKFYLNTAFKQSTTNYTNPLSLAKVNFASPYNKMRLGVPLDVERVRSGESKYLIRELYQSLYGDDRAVKKAKIPMPRAVDQFFIDWKGPARSEFKDNLDMTLFSGDQKWMMYALERFLNLSKIEDI